MAVTFFPFNSIVVDGVPDRPANAENLAAYLAGFFSDGVIMHEDTALKVEAYSGMEVQINAGMGNIKGKTILNDAAEVVTLAAASASLDRIDRVIFRLDEVNRLMEFDVLTGTPASSPVAPALTWTADVYELCLAEIRVPAGASEILASYITDTRADIELCGTSQIPAHMQDIKHGGTGLSVETLEELLLALGGASITKLWENASSTSEFETQTINMDFSDYPILIVFHRVATNYSGAEASMLLRGYEGRLTAFAVGAQKIRTRTATYNNNSITFYNGYLESAVDNSCVIPMRIFGVRGVK